MSPPGQVGAVPAGQNAAMRAAHSVPVRPAASWPAALLPGALLLALLGGAAGQTASGSDLPATELHVVDGPAPQR